MRLIGAMLAVLMVVTSAAADELTVHREILDNGLTVLIVPSARAPVISHNLIINAGGADDAAGASGVAHYLEHMLFKGTPTYPEGEYSARIEALGGQYNAYTSTDMTGYYVTASAEHLETIMTLESDRMMHLAPSADDYPTEREVVREERRLRTDGNPAALLGEAMRAALFRHHPYGTPIIGWPHEIDGLDELSAMAFFRRFYSPANTTLLIVGDVVPAKAVALAKKYYGTWHGAPKQPRKWLREPARIASQIVSLRHTDVSSPRWSRAYVAPSLGMADNDNQILPLLYVEELLGNGRTGLLYERLVREQRVATGVSVSYNPFAIGPVTLRISVVPADGVSLDAIADNVEAVIAEFVANIPDIKAMDRARNQMVASTIYARDDIQGLASILAQLVAIGKEAEWFNAWQQHVAHVSAAQVKSAAEGLFNHDSAVTGYLLPARDETGV